MAEGARLLTVTPLRRAWLREMGIERIWSATPVSAPRMMPQPMAVDAAASSADVAATVSPGARAPTVAMPLPAAVAASSDAMSREPVPRGAHSPAREAVEMARRAAGLLQRAGGGAKRPFKADAIPAASAVAFPDAQSAQDTEMRSAGIAAPIPAVVPSSSVPVVPSPALTGQPAHAPSAADTPPRIPLMPEQGALRVAPVEAASDHVGEVAPVAPITDRFAQDPAWDTLQGEVMGCVACGLCESRTQPVFGVGPRNARWMVVGEAPGEQEDRQGDPFVGRSGQLLDSMLSAIGLSRQRDVFIANVIKCRPPGNRNPRPEEVATCSPYLMRQMALLKPERILLLGSFAAQTLLNTKASVGSLRGKVHTLSVEGGSVPVVVSYHPAYLLRSPHEKARTWQDLRLAVSATA